MRRQWKEGGGRFAADQLESRGRGYLRRKVRALWGKKKFWTVFSSEMQIVEWALWKRNRQMDRCALQLTKGRRSWKDKQDPTCRTECKSEFLSPLWLELWLLFCLFVWCFTSDLRELLGVACYFEFLHTIVRHNSNIALHLTYAKYVGVVRMSQFMHIRWAV